MWHHFLCPQGGEGRLSQSQPRSSLADDSSSHLSSNSRIARSPARNPLSFRTMQTKVTLLDGSLFTCTVEVRQLETGETDGTGENMIKDELCPVSCVETVSWSSAVWESLWPCQPAGERLLRSVLQRCRQQQGTCLSVCLSVCLFAILSVCLTLPFVL